MMSDRDAIVVAVRCRPFNKRELAMRSKLVVRMENNTTILTPDDTHANAAAAAAALSPISSRVAPTTTPSAPVEFTFDYSYWSFDPSSPQFADNRQVFSDLGVSVLENAWAGYNSTLLAYGQTGSGKSFSMVGSEAEDERGIVPRVIQLLFERIASDDSPGVQYRLEASMMELYMEKVYDLFASPTAAATTVSHSKKKQGLKVRDHPSTGPYVEGLTRCALPDYTSFNRLLRQGAAARTVAFTQMNATSSRAHTIFQLTLTKLIFDAETQKSYSQISKVNLVDLAGSERMAKTGAEGKAKAEGIEINKSLSALGGVIEQLAKRGAKGDSATGGSHIQFRNSVLTWLLRESLGGNARTIMIAAISPAADNYAETLSTLRYANKMKAIKNKAVKNESEEGKVIRTLKAEIQKLRDDLQRAMEAAQGKQLSAVVSPIPPSSFTPTASPPSVVASSPSSGGSSESDRELLKLRAKLKQNEALIVDMNKSWLERMAETESIAFKKGVALQHSTHLQQVAEDEENERQKRMQPHLVNLHKDAMLSETLRTYFPSDRPIQFGSREEMDVLLAPSSTILPHHATAVRIDTVDAATGGAVHLTAMEGAAVFVNGKRIDSSTAVRLHHRDRIIMANQVFRMVEPLSSEAAADGSSEATLPMDWDEANKELLHNSKQWKLRADLPTGGNTRSLPVGYTPDAATVAAAVALAADHRVAVLKRQLEEERQAFQKAMSVLEEQHAATLIRLRKKQESELAALRAQLADSSKSHLHAHLRAVQSQREQEFAQEVASVDARHKLAMLDLRKAHTLAASAIEGEARHETFRAQLARSTRIAQQQADEGALDSTSAASVEHAALARLELDEHWLENLDVDAEFDFEDECNMEHLDQMAGDLLLQQQATRRAAAITSRKAIAEAAAEAEALAELESDLDAGSSESEDFELDDEALDAIQDPSHLSDSSLSSSSLSSSRASSSIGAHRTGDARSGTHFRHSSVPVLSLGQAHTQIEDVMPFTERTQDVLKKIDLLDTMQTQRGRK